MLRGSPSHSSVHIISTVARRAPQHDESLKVWGGVKSRLAHVNHTASRECVWLAGRRSAMRAGGCCCVRRERLRRQLFPIPPFSAPLRLRVKPCAGASAVRRSHRKRVASFSVSATLPYHDKYRGGVEKARGASQLSQRCLMMECVPRGRQAENQDREHTGLGRCALVRNRKGREGEASRKRSVAGSLTA